MGRVKVAALTAMLLTLGGGAEAQRQGTVQQGVQRTFTVNDLTNDKLGRIVASSEYQVSITLPGEVQNVGVNASKQAALMPTVDKSDGRVIYLDVLKPGGFASLNIRLVSAGTPVVLKMTVELSKATSGVREYTITGTPQTQAAAPAPTAPRGAATSGPTPAAAPSASARPRAATAAPARPAPSPPRPSTPARPATTVTPPPPAATPRPVAATSAPTRPGAGAGRPSTPALPAQTPSRPPAAPATTPAARGAGSTSVQGGLRIEVTIAPGQTGPTRTLTYKITDAASGDNLSYILMPRATVRATAQKMPENVPLSPGTAQRVTASGAQGTATLSAASLSGFGTPVLLFEVLPVDTQAQKPLARKYVGVAVKP
ncbi:hypothetical protein [Deinococcus terrestris]|uniref:hypothetical protein n=1 Tax=Deinococcus terrestris TaxID=2651870 RepID=UPI00128E7121|nr:hypothetical protein [Deinococcus terrestris]